MKIKISSLFALIAIMMIYFSCKAKQKTAKSEPPKQVVPTTSEQPVADTLPVRKPFPRHDTGIVSHRYAPDCKAVVISNKIRNGDTLMYVPMQGLNGFDSAGMKIEFDYVYLKIMNQKGCVKAIPVIIKNVKKLN